MNTDKWQFWVDQGGTFTDVIGVDPNGNTYTCKVLSKDTQGGYTAVQRGVTKILSEVAGDTSWPSPKIGTINVGTTVGTNAMLEHKVAKTALFITADVRDALSINYQQRPSLFDLHIDKDPDLYSTVISVHERLNADGQIILPLEPKLLRDRAVALYEEGYQAVAICLLHAWKNPVHELALGNALSDIGFLHISLSHQILPEMRLIGRGGTTLANSALTPVLDSAFASLKSDMALSGSELSFLQSNGNLTLAQDFRGCDSLLSGPAGGVNGGVTLAQQHDIGEIIGFDMGGTSTDVWHYKDSFERLRETKIAGCFIRTPVMDVRTIASGGGSVLTLASGRFQVGPKSSGAIPGPACYGLGGPATVTDANMVTGRLVPHSFQPLFGQNANALPDPDLSKAALANLAQSTDDTTIAKMAEEFLYVASKKMARAIYRQSIERSFNASSCTLLCLGGASGQLACQVADSLDIQRIFLHSLTSVMSAYGVGNANLGGVYRYTANIALDQHNSESLITEHIQRVLRLSAAEVGKHTSKNLKDLKAMDTTLMASLSYADSDQCLHIPLATSGPPNIQSIKAAFTDLHKQNFGYIRQGGQNRIILESLVVEMTTKTNTNSAYDRSPRPLFQPNETTSQTQATQPSKAMASGDMLAFRNGEFVRLPVLPLTPSLDVQSPALVIHPQFTLSVEAGWRLESDARDGVLLHKMTAKPNRASTQSPQPNTHTTDTDLTKDSFRHKALLENFVGLFTSVAEKMGISLAKTATSVNIRERLDYSCALFTKDGALLVNAPHIPVHLGSMSESITALLHAHQDGTVTLAPKQYYASNSPYNGGTHLPDITVISPCFLEGELAFFVAARGHHAEIGGIELGGMPASSTTLEEEGIVFDNDLIATDGVIDYETLRSKLTQPPWPSRNVPHNIADLEAQIAACHTGIEELISMSDTYTLPSLQYWSECILDTGEAAINRLIPTIKPTHTHTITSQGKKVALQIAVDTTGKTPKLTVDFTGTAWQGKDNFNASKAVTRACVLYALRCATQSSTGEDIPLNDGCLRQVEIVIPDGTLLSAVYPAAVVAGNVETSQIVAGLLLYAMNLRAESQGTMNNLTFGNENWQYYETIAGGSGAGPDFPGANAVHTDMTNSRLTDPEVIETRFPVRIERLEYRPQSGGDGRLPGGDGLIRQVRFLQKVSCSIISSNRGKEPNLDPPNPSTNSEGSMGAKGLNGGSNGQLGRNYHLDTDNKETPLPGSVTLTLNEGEAIRIETPGGGGYGRADLR